MSCFGLRTLLLRLPQPAPRYRPLDRDRCSHASLEQQRPHDHEVRAVWQVVEHFDFAAFPARVNHDRFVSQVAAWRSLGGIALQRVTVDGTKVPAAAGKESCHREPTWPRHLAAAEAHGAAWEQQRAAAHDRSARQQAVRRRAAHERRARLRRALDTVHAVQQQRAAAHRPAPPPEEAWASESDPDVRRMKFPHGGCALAYNVATLLELQHALIVTTTVTHHPSDHGLLRPLLEQVEQEQGSKPEEVLADSGFVDAEDIDPLEEAGVRVLMPPQKARKELRAGKDPYAPKRRATPGVAAWRARMGSPPAQESYRQRCGPAERVHAWMEQRPWRRFRRRGLRKARLEALGQALAHNVSRLLALPVPAAAPALTVRVGGSEQAWQRAAKANGQGQVERQEAGAIVERVVGRPRKNDRPITSQTLTLPARKRFTARENPLNHAEHNS